MMNSGIVYRDSATSKVLLKLKELAPGAIFTIDDLREIKDVTYDAIRSVVIRLHKQNYIQRVCRGIYFLPLTKTKDFQFPSVERILDSLAKKEHFKYCPVGEYAEYIIGLTQSLPKEIVCYTTGKIRLLKLENGIKIRLVPCKKKSFQSTINIKLHIVRQYLHDVGLQGLSKEAKQIINNYIESTCTTNFIRDVKGSGLFV